jgi:hypothetical protein
MNVEFLKGKSEHPASRRCRRRDHLKLRDQSVGRQGSSSRKTWLIVAENLDDCHIYKIIYSEQNISPGCSRKLLCDVNGRGDWIRTSDPLRPRQVRYQAALRPDWNS